MLILLLVMDDTPCLGCCVYPLYLLLHCNLLDRVASWEQA